MTEPPQAAPDGTSAQMKQAARSVGADGEQGVVELFMPLRKQRADNRIVV